MAVDQLYPHIRVVLSVILGLILLVATALAYQICYFAAEYFTLTSG